MELLKRKIDTYLLDWKRNPQKKPLIVKGARVPTAPHLSSLSVRTGDTTLSVLVH